MPYKIIKQHCVQANGTEGNYILVKADSGQKVSCHVTEEIAKKAIAARHMRESYTRKGMFLQEAKEILNNIVNKVICHITGPAGAGKTTILNDLKEKYPQFEYIDLDDIEKEATISLHFENTKRYNYTHKMYYQLHLEKQKILDKYLNNSNKKFVLCGFHDEFPRLYHSKPDDKIHQINYPKNYHLNIHTDNKFFLNISAELSTDRFISRATSKGRNVSKEDKIKLVSHAKDVLKQFKEMGYKPMTHNTIMKWFEKYVSPRS